ncbi:antirepressor SinI [Oceanobacillus arenosus]|uniref:Antirepressor SinI n=2 Tax=Oceanobacillus arenosus TaxID=1229153 RepID=A0A3D8PLT1_9BACI|nr:antirepressor SinI [Oceanobacillus arenosus]
MLDTDNSNLYDQDWINLIVQAKELGLSPADVKTFLKNAAYKQDENTYILDALNL